MVKLKLWGVFLAPLAFGCSLLPQTPSDVRESIEKPEHHFKSDLDIELEGKVFEEGFAATKLEGPVTFTAKSKFKMEKVIIESCHRDYVVDVNANAFTWTFKPLETELACKAGTLVIRGYDSKGLTDWGIIAFRSDETLATAEMGVDCNGRRWSWAGYSVCNHKRDKPQRIRFAETITHANADEKCHMKRLDDKSFELRPELGECSAVFTNGKAWHTSLFIGYEREFLR